VRNPDEQYGEHQTVIEGDILSSGSTERVLKEVRKQGGKIHAFFFRPVGGLGGHGHSMRSHMRLYGVLQKVYPYLAEHCEGYIAMHHFQGAPLLSRVLTTQDAHLCKKGRKRNGTDYFLVRRSPSAPERLKTIEELRHVDGIEKEFHTLMKE
jgi:hypothetical protein